MMLGPGSALRMGRRLKWVYSDKLHMLRKECPELDFATNSRLSGLEWARSLNALFVFNFKDEDQKHARIPD